MQRVMLNIHDATIAAAAQAVEAATARVKAIGAEQGERQQGRAALIAIAMAADTERAGLDDTRRELLGKLADGVEQAAADLDTLGTKAARLQQRANDYRAAAALRDPSILALNEPLQAAAAARSRAAVHLARLHHGRAVERLEAAVDALQPLIDEYAGTATAVVGLTRSMSGDPNAEPFEASTARRLARFMGTWLKAQLGPDANELARPWPPEFTALTRGLEDLADLGTGKITVRVEVSA